MKISVTRGYRGYGPRTALRSYSQQQFGWDGWAGRLRRDGRRMRVQRHRSLPLILLLDPSSASETSSYVLAM